MCFSDFVPILWVNKLGRGHMILKAGGTIATNATFSIFIKINWVSRSMSNFQYVCEHPAYFVFYLYARVLVPAELASLPFNLLTLPAFYTLSNNFKSWIATDKLSLSSHWLQNLSKRVIYKRISGWTIILDMAVHGHSRSAGKLSNRLGAWQFLNAMLEWLRILDTTSLEFNPFETRIFTRKQMSKMERHLRMLEKLGIRSTDFWLNTNTQTMLPGKLLI